MKISSVTFNAPVLTPIDKKNWKLWEECRVCVNFDKSPSQYFNLPANMVTDLGSVPWIVQPIIPKQGDWGITIAYLVHDFIYEHGSHSRKYADDLLYAMLRDAKMGSVKAAMVYRAVRMFGGSHYNKGAK